MDTESKWDEIKAKKKKNDYGDPYLKDPDTYWEEADINWEEVPVQKKTKGHRRNDPNIIPKSQPPKPPVEIKPPTIKDISHRKIKGLKKGSTQNEAILLMR